MTLAIPDIHASREECLAFIRANEPAIQAVYALADAGVVDFADWRTIVSVLRPFVGEK